MKIFRLFIFLILFTQACQAQLSKSEAEKMIIGVWQAVPYPKPPQGKFPDFMYKEMLAMSSPIVSFTNEYQYIDSIRLKMYGENSNEFEKMQWSISEDAKYFFFNSKKKQTLTKFLIHKLDKDTFWLKYEENNADILFLKKIQRYELPTMDISILPPPKQSEERLDEVKQKSRNVLKIVAQKNGQILLANKPIASELLRQKVKEFIVNKNKNPQWSESPQEALISFNSEAGTKYSFYIRVLDEIKAAYHELRAQTLGVSLDNYLRFDEEKARKEEKFIQKIKIFCAAINESFGQKTIKKYLDFDSKLDKNQAYLEAYQKARKSSPDTFLEKYYDAQRQYPMRISEAEPTKIGG
jgi:biopolymer transport protein ExbD